LKGKNPSEANIQKARLLRIPIVDEDFLEKCICQQAIAFPWFLLEPSKHDSKEFSATKSRKINEKRQSLHNIERYADFNIETCGQEKTASSCEEETRTNEAQPNSEEVCSNED